MIDPITEDNWLQDNFRSRPYVEEGDTFEDFTPAYRYGALAESRYGDAGIDLMDPQLQSDWEASKESDMPWTKAKGAVQDAYSPSTCQTSRRKPWRRTAWSLVIPIRCWPNSWTPPRMSSARRSGFSGRDRRTRR